MKDTEVGMRICVFDSGIGGLPYYKALKEAFPDITLFYIADNAGFPYGTKTPELIRNILFERVRRIRSRLMPDILVLSCMTAVEVGLRELQATHQSLPIIGVYPPLGRAAAESATRIIALLTTARAAEDAFIDDLVAREASEVEVLRIPAQDLVDFIEHQLPFAGPEASKAMVAPYASYIASHGADRIVIASSHLVFLEDAFHAAMAQAAMYEVKCLDSRESLVRQLLEIRSKVQKTDTASNAQAETGFFLTGDQNCPASYRLWASTCGLPEPEIL